jgi:hypothetical protein
MFHLIISQMNSKLCKWQRCRRYKQLQSGQEVCCAAGQYIPVAAMCQTGCRQVQQPGIKRNLKRLMP